MNLNYLPKPFGALFSPFLKGFVPTGPAGGKFGSSSNSTTPQFVRHLLAGNISESSLWNRLSANPHAYPEFISLVINNHCNLACAHCYLQVPKLTGPALSREEWCRMAETLFGPGVKFVSIAGKEALLGKQSRDIIHELTMARNASASKARLGLVTNGTLLDPFRNFVRECRFDTLDISLDGMLGDHDAVRGPGAFASASPAVRWAAREMPDSFFLSTTLQRQNYNRIPQALLQYADLGVSNVGLSFMIPTSMTEPGLALSKAETESVFDSLSSLRHLALKRPMTVVIEVSCDTPIALEAFIGSRWFDAMLLEPDNYDNLWIDHRVSDELLLQFKFVPIPTSIHRLARITPEGNYLALQDIFETSLYQNHSLANIRDFDFDFRRMHEAAKRHRRPREIVSHYFDAILPNLVRAYAKDQARAHACVA